MGVVAVAVAVGMAAGLLARRRPGRGASPVLHWVPVLLAGAVAQWLPEAVALPAPAGSAVALGSYAALLTFASRNRSLPGMPLVLLGLGLNLVVVAANGGMPVRGGALVDAGLVEPGELPAVDLGARRHLESPDDHLAFLGDVVAVPALREVVSAGDLVLAAGLAAVAFGAVRSTAPAGAATPVTGSGGAVATGNAAPPERGG